MAESPLRRIKMGHLLTARKSATSKAEEVARRIMGKKYPMKSPEPEEK